MRASKEQATFSPVTITVVLESAEELSNFNRMLIDESNNMVICTSVRLFAAKLYCSLYPS